MPQDLALFMVIDGVDEYSGNHFQFARFLARVARYPFVKVLVSSRPIPACYQVFSSFPGLQLQDLTQSDIQSYIQVELIRTEQFQARDHLEPGFSDDVADKLAKKASGVFLWVVLVVAALLEQLGNFDGKEQILETIDDLPEDLEKLYKHMFGALNEQHQREGALFLLIMSYVHEHQEMPLSAYQFYLLDQYFQGRQVWKAQLTVNEYEKHLQIEAVKGRLRSRCWGLVEVQNTCHTGELRQARVGFHHRTVYDYVQTFEMQQILKNLSDYTTAQIRVALLLVWCQRLIFETSNLVQGDIHAVFPVFEECLAYSNQLAHDNDDSYLQYLEAADECVTKAILAIASSADAEKARFTGEEIEVGIEPMYNNFYDSLYERLQVRLGARVSSRKVPLGCNIRVSALTMFARLGLPAYFHAKLSGLPKDKESDVQVLFYLLDTLCESSLHPVIRNSCRLAISALFRCKAPAHLTIPVCLQNGSYTDLELSKRLQLVSAECVDVKHISPWCYWLLVCTNEKFYDLRVTLALLENGGQLWEHYAKFRELVKKFEQTLINAKKNCSEQDKKTIVDILQILRQKIRETNADSERNKRNNIPSFKIEKSKPCTRKSGRKTSQVK